MDYSEAVQKLNDWVHELWEDGGLKWYFKNSIERSCLKTSGGYFICTVEKLMINNKTNIETHEKNPPEVE